MNRLVIYYLEVDHNPAMRVVRCLTEMGISSGGHLLAEDEMSVVCRAPSCRDAASEIRAVWLSEHSLDTGWGEGERHLERSADGNAAGSNMLVLRSDDVAVPPQLQGRRLVEFTDGGFDGGIAEIANLPIFSSSLRVGAALFRDIVFASEQLTRAVAPLGRAIGEQWLDTPASDRWLPYRPDGLAARGLSGGTCDDRVAELGWAWDEDEGEDVGSLRFRWVGDERSWCAVNNPFEFPQDGGFVFNLDGLVYLKTHVGRLLRDMLEQLARIERADLFGASDAVRRELGYVAGAFREAGDRPRRRGRAASGPWTKRPAP